MNIVRALSGGFVPQIPLRIITLRARSDNQQLALGSLMGENSQTGRRNQALLFGFTEFVSCVDSCDLLQRLIVYDSGMR